MIRKVIFIVLIFFSTNSLADSEWKKTNVNMSEHITIGDYEIISTNTLGEYIQYTLVNKDQFLPIILCNVLFINNQIPKSSVCYYEE